MRWECGVRSIKGVWWVVLPILERIQGLYVKRREKRLLPKRPVGMDVGGVF
jgi:hypothetical protein